MISLAEGLPAEQARVRELLEQYQETARLCPQANCTFAIMSIKAELKEAEEAAASGDIVRMLRAYNTLKDAQ